MEALYAWKKRSTAPTRAAAARELAGDPDPRSGLALTKAVSDKDWSVRAAAIEAIAKRGDTSLLVDIIPAMAHRKDIVRYPAAAGVLRLGTVNHKSRPLERITESDSLTSSWSGRLGVTAVE
jgi:HEAT repeat protein